MWERFERGSSSILRRLGRDVFTTLRCAWRFNPVFSSTSFDEFGREINRDRILLGLERREKEGKKLGRPKGSKDKKRRRKSGYLQRWASKKTTPLKSGDFSRENYA